MFKEWMIIAVVILIVIGLNVVTNHYLKENVFLVSNQLNELREEILKENQEESKLKMQTIKEKWNSIYHVLAYYIEHDELEKVATELTRLAAHIDTEEYKECINQIDTTIFILEHIQEKEQFDWISIF